MLLAIDTATRVMSLALIDDDGIAAEQTLRTRNQQTVQLTAAIHHLLTLLDTSVESLTALAIAEGPGSFSGLRVGFGVAKGLALARNLPLIPVPTLDIIAHGSPYYEGRLLAVIQAGRGRIIAGGYEWRDERWQSADAPQITSWEAVVRQDETLINGEIDARGHDLLREAGKTCVSAGGRLRRAGFLAELGWTAFRDGDYPEEAAEVNPKYLKEP